MDDFEARKARYMLLHDQFPRELLNPDLVEAGKRLTEARLEWLGEYEAKAREAVQAAFDPAPGGERT